jgi:chemotaxis protein CheD
MTHAHVHLPRLRYFDKHFGRHAIKLLPGEFLATTEQVLLVTVLGSCVAVCLRDKERGIAGMNHFMLPATAEEAASIHMPARFGVHAMELLINDMLKLGARREALEAKVFGAGTVLDGVTMAKIGEKNADFVREYLAEEHIPLLAQDLCGPHARKVYFFLDSGKVMVKKIRPERVVRVVQEEERYRRRLVGELPQGGEIDLFI